MDASLANGDEQAPEAFRELSAYTYRIEAERCSGGSCTASSCGDEGYLLVQFAAPADAETEPLGYRLVWDGEVKPSLRRELTRVMPLDPQTGSIALRLSFEEITKLDGELSMVAIDRAGNESEPSEPVRVSWSGCTEYFDDPHCAEAKMVVPPGANAQCTLVSGPHGGRGLPLAAAAVALGLAATASARRRQRRRRKLTDG